MSVMHLRHHVRICVPPEDFFEERVTFCLTHSLNIENGIPSACDLDFNSLLTQAILENLSGKSVYMGNANVCSLEDGKLPTIFGDFDDAHIDHLMINESVQYFPCNTNTKI